MEELNEGHGQISGKKFTKYISPKDAKNLKIGDMISTDYANYKISGYGFRTGATRDFEAYDNEGERYNLRVSLRGATGIQVAQGRSLNFPEKEEMLSESLDKIIDEQMENLDEGRHQVKRKYAQYNRIRVNENGASVRDTIIKYIGKNYVTEEDLHNHLIRLEEDRGGTKVNKAKWFKRNQKFFSTFERRNTKYYSLSKYGQRVLEMINKRDAAPNEVNESTTMNIPSMAEFIAVNEEFKAIVIEELNEGIVEDIRENLIDKPLAKIKSLYKKYIGAEPRKEIASNAKAMITLIATMAAENKNIAKAVLMECEATEESTENNED